MWPDEETLEDAVPDPSGNSHFGEAWAEGDQGNGDGISQEIVLSRSEDESVKDEGASEGGLGAGGGLREEWEMMTPDEKVCKLIRETCYLVLVNLDLAW